MKVGDTAVRSLTVSGRMILEFAELVGDRNPIHLDEDFARQSRFGRRIAHGMIAASLISAVIGNDLPGPGSIYINQSLQFVAPVFIGDTIKATVRTLSIKEGKPIATLETVCTNQRDEVVLKGEATVLFPSSS